MKRRLVFLLACHSEADPVQHSHTGEKKKEKKSEVRRVCTLRAASTASLKRPRKSQTSGSLRRFLGKPMLL